MSGSDDATLLQDYRREYGNGFSPLKLWRDRSQILSDPAIAARPNPALANSPVRFALSLSLIPILVIGLATSLFVELFNWDRESQGLFEGRDAEIAQVFAPDLPGMTPEQIEALSRDANLSDMHPAAQSLVKTPGRVLSMSLVMEPAAVQAELRAWLRDVHASPLTPGHQRVLVAKVASFAHKSRRQNHAFNWYMRNLSEGGPVMQFIGVVSLLLGAWLFRHVVTGDARFVNAERADRFYLYYANSRLFWFLVATTLSYGIVSYASASGNRGLYETSLYLNSAISVAAVVYLLAHSREMARALCDTQTPPAGSAFALGWRVLASQVAAAVAMMVAAGSVGFLLGVSTAIL